jgi:transposase-like protein
MKSGKNAQNRQRYRCKNSICPTITFMLDYRYNACAPGIKEKVVEMAIINFAHKPPNHLCNIGLF